MKPILECIGLTKQFGSFRAVSNLDFTVFPGEIFGIAGPNGAGKTTLFNIITKIPYPPTSGKTIFQGEEIQQMKNFEIVHKGIARTFQIPTVFEKFSYSENVKCGALFGKKYGKESVDEIEKKCLSALETVGLLEKKDQIATDLPLFDMKRIMLASALATNPSLLLLDEPVSALSSIEIEEIIKLIKQINEKGTTIILIEHHMRTLMGISERVLILHRGEKLAEGIPKEVAGNELVIEAYLGEDYKKYLGD
jgi:branched-chain amino acid transport system ATP-binding protein